MSDETGGEIALPGHTLKHAHMHPQSATNAPWCVEAREGGADGGLISAPPEPEQPHDAADHNGCADGNNVRRIFRGHGCRARIAAAHTHLCILYRDLRPPAEHFSSMGKLFLALVCVGTIVELWAKVGDGIGGKQWYRARTADVRGGTRKTMIVALARKLLIALWRMVTTGEIPEGISLRPAVA